MRPHLRMLAGEEQEIFAGDNIPIPVASTDALGPVLGNPFRVNQNVERQDVGITLRVRPTVGEAGGVQLELEVDTTSLAPPTAGDLEEVGPTIRQRRLTSKIQLQDGEFAVVGFAREPAFERTTTGVPWLSDVPIFGWAFKSTVERSLTARFVIAAQARIERSPEERLADSIRRRLAFERSIAGRERAPAGAPTAWALRVATLADAAEAQAVAERVGTSERPASVRRWESSAGPVFDVQVSGFSELSQTGAAALALREAGFDPELIVLPIEGP
jgi:type II secretory pathway component GspD/PulD (secretin)